VVGFLLLVNFSIAGCYILFTLLALQLLGHWAANRKLDGFPPYFKYFLVYIGATLLTTIFSIDRIASIKDNRDLLIYLLIPIFILVINSKKRLLISFGAVLLSAILSSGTGIVNAATKGLSLDHRLKGFVSHWMTYSGLLMFVFIFFFVYLFYQKEWKHKLILGGGLLILLAAILFSLTRSVWVGMIVALGLFIVYYKPKILYFALPALAAVFLLLPQTVKTRVFSIFDMNNASNKDRIYMVHTGKEIFKRHPLTGVGANNVKEVYHLYQHPDAAQANPHLHNNFLQILAERGLLGLLSLLLAFGALFYYLVKRIRHTEGEAKIVALGALFLFIGFLTWGMFEYNWGDTEITFLLFFFISIPFLRDEAYVDRVTQ
jgi:O-antigen ligase